MRDSRVQNPCYSHYKWESKVIIRGWTVTSSMLKKKESETFLGGYRLQYQYNLPIWCVYDFYNVPCSISMEFYNTRLVYDNTFVNVG